MTVKRDETVLLVGTRKGLFVFHSRDRRRWKQEGPHFAGVPVYHAILDPRDGKTIHAGAMNEHWGPTMKRSKV